MITKAESVVAAIMEVANVTVCTAVGLAREAWDTVLSYVMPVAHPMEVCLNLRQIHKLIFIECIQ